MKIDMEEVQLNGKNRVKLHFYGEQTYLVTADNHVVISGRMTT